MMSSWAIISAGVIVLFGPDLFELVVGGKWIEASVNSHVYSRINSSILFFIINQRRFDYEEIQGNLEPRRAV